jgi:hypothetical protein
MSGAYSKTVQISVAHPVALDYLHQVLHTNCSSYLTENTASTPFPISLEFSTKQSAFILRITQNVEWATLGFPMLNQAVHIVTTGLKRQHHQAQLFLRKHTPIKALLVATCFGVSVHCLARSVQHVSVSKNACHMSMSQMFCKHRRQSQPSALTHCKPRMRLELRIPANYVKVFGT